MPIQQQVAVGNILQPQCQFNNKEILNSLAVSSLLYMILASYSQPVHRRRDYDYRNDVNGKEERSTHFHKIVQV